MFIIGRSYISQHGDSAKCVHIFPDNGDVLFVSGRHIVLTDREGRNKARSGFMPSGNFLCGNMTDTLAAFDGTLTAA